MKCAACSREGLRSTTLALILPQCERGRVCSECERRGVLVVASTVPPVITTEPAERRAQADVLAPFISRLKGLAANLKAQAYGADKLDDERRSTIVETYEAVIHMLKEGRT
jgi:hypothetical protein